MHYLFIYFSLDSKEKIYVLSEVPAVIVGGQIHPHLSLLPFLHTCISLCEYFHSDKKLCQICFLELDIPNFLGESTKKKL